MRLLRELIPDGRCPGRTGKLLLPGALCLLVSACGWQAPGARPLGAELVYAESSATWFEDDHVAAAPTADGRWLLVADWRFRKAIELSTGREATLDEAAPGHGLDRLFGVADAGGGRTALYGIRGRESGWFVQGPDGPTYTGLSPAASAAWSADGRSVAYVVAGSDTLFIEGEPGELRVGIGRPAGPAVWARDGRSIYVIVRADDGAGTLLRVGTVDGAIDVLRDRLYISIVTSRLAVHEDGSRLFLSLASLAAPAADARHSPTPRRPLDIYAFDLTSSSLEAIVHTPHDDFAPITAGAWL